MTEDGRYTDALGIPFSQIYQWVPNISWNASFPKKIENKKAAYDWKYLWHQLPCWWCSRETCDDSIDSHGEVHHVVRHDATWAFAWLCSTCHRHTGEGVTTEALGRLLYLKWRWDCRHTSWLHLAVAYRSATGKYLPELQEVRP